MEPALTRKSFLDHAGSVAKTIVKHVPTRGVLWGVIGFVTGVVCVLLSYLIGLASLGRGAMVLGYLVAIPVAIPFLGAALFTVHGLHRGAARAMLDLERQSGLVSWIVDRVLGLLTDKLGGPASNLPLQQIETALKDVIARWLQTSEGNGIGAWVMNRAKRALTGKIESYLLAAYRAEQKSDGSGGGVSLEKVGNTVKRELSENLAGLVMGPLNKQLALFMGLYVILAGGWWYWLFLLIRLFSGSSHA